MKKVIFTCLAIILLVSLMVSCSAPAPTTTAKPTTAAPAPATTAAPAPTTTAAPAPTSTAAPAPTTTAAPPSTTAAANVINLRFTMYFPAESFQTKAGQAWYQEIEKRSNGQVKFTYFPGGSLVDGPGTTDAIKNGAADIGYMSIGHVAGRFPVMESMMSQVGFSSAYINGHVAADFFNKFKPKEWDGFQVLVPGCNGAFVTFTNKPVNILADWKGLKIRAPGNTGKQIALLGASAVNIPMSDAFDSLTKGVIDGNASAMEAAKTWRLGEACKYVIQTAQCISPAPYMLIMNKDSYAKLPDNIKKIFADVSADYIDRFGMAWNDADMDAWAYLKQMKTTVIDPTQDEMNKWIAAVQPLKQDYVKNMVGKGYTEAEVNSWFDYQKTQTDYWLQQQIKAGVKSPIGPAAIRAQ